MDSKKDGSGFSIPDVDNIDIGRIGSLYGVRKPRDTHEPEYLEFNKRGRDIFGRLNFNTGLCWASAFTLAGLYGFQEGWRGATSSIFRVRFNSVLNGISKRGNKAANICGVLAFMHTSFTYLAETYDFDRKLRHEVATPAFAGAMTGLVFTSTRRPLVMAYGTGIGCVASIAYFYAQSYVYDALIAQRRMRRY